MKIPLTIEFDNVSGSINLSGPLQDKIFCLGLMEMAKQVIINLKEQSLVQPVPGFVMPPKGPHGPAGRG